MTPESSGDTRTTPESLRELIVGLDWRQELLGIALVLAETSLVYLVTGFLLPDTSAEQRVLAAWVVGMLLLVAHMVPRLLDEWRIWSPEYEGIMAGAIAISTLVTVKAGSFPSIAVWDMVWIRQTVRALALLPNDAVRPVWGIVILSAYAWWRGRSRAEPSVDAAYAMLRTGTFVLALVIVMLLIAAPDDSQVRERLSAGTVSFFVAALAAVGIARLRLEGFRTSSPLGPRWLATFVAPILAVVVVAIVGAGIFSRQFLDTVLWMLTPVFFVLSIVFQVFVLILAIIAYIVLTPLVWLVGDREARVVQPSATPAQQQPGPLDQVSEAPLQVPDPLRYLIAAIILLVIASLLTKFIFRRRRRERTATDEERESVLEWTDLFGSLQQRLRGIFNRASDEEDPLSHLRADPRWQYTLAIRESYLRLQNRGRQIGRPRRESETAGEYQPNVVRSAPGEEVAPAVNTLTNRYRTARYSGQPATPEQAAEAEAAARRIEQAIPPPST